MDIFIPTFVFILKLFGLSILGYLIFRNRFLKKYYQVLLFYTVDVSLPILIFHRMVFNLTPELLRSLNYLMAISAGLVVLGIFIGKLILKFFPVAAGKENLFCAILAFGNVGYLPLPLMEAILKGPDLVQAQIYIFFFIIPFNLLIWSIGVPLSLNENISLKKFKFTLTMPFIFVVLSLALSPFVVKQWIPAWLGNGMELVGSTVNPAIMVMLGGAFSNFDLSHIQLSRDVILILLVKLVLFPLLAFPLVLFSSFPFILKLVLIIEAAVPPAVNLVIINKRYGNQKSGDNLTYILSSLVYTYLFSIFSLPLVISLFRVFHQK
ncbi:MAG: AEC family transporter [bacterium]|nr:AEC family transporter [bacterium]